MRCFLVIVQAKWFVFIPHFPEPLQGVFRSDFSYGTLKPLAYSIDEKIGIVVVSLARQYHRIIEPLWQSIQVDFTDHGCLLRIGLKNCRKIGLFPIERL